MKVVAALRRWLEAARQGSRLSTRRVYREPSVPLDLACALARRSRSLFTSGAPGWWSELAPGPRRLIARAARDVVELAREPSLRPGTLDARAALAAEACRRAHRDGVSRLLEANRESEATIRTLDWAFASRSRTFRFVSTSRRNVDWGRWAARASIGAEPVVWWTARAPVPAEIAAAAANGKLILIADAETTLRIDEARGRILLAGNAARVTGVGAHGGRRSIALSGAAAVVQAIGCERDDGAWRPLVPPRDFEALAVDVRLSDVRRGARAFQGPLAASGDGRSLVVPAGALRKLAGSPLYVIGAAWDASPKRRFGMDEDLDKGKVLVQFPEEAQEWAERQTTPHAVYFSGLTSSETPRTGDELTRAFVEYTAESVEDLLRQIEVPIAATVRDPEGQDVHIGCRATSVSSFDEAGLTEAIPELYTWYVRTRVYDEIQASGKTQLTPEELERLEQEIALLERFSNGGEA